MDLTKLEKELERLAKKFGGGWRIERDVMPIIVLTLKEAQALEHRVKPRETPRGYGTADYS